MTHIINIIVIFISFNNMTICQEQPAYKLLYLTTASYRAVYNKEFTNDLEGETTRLLSYTLMESNCGNKLKSDGSNACGPWHLMPKWFGECLDNWFDEAERALDIILQFRRMCGLKNEPSCFRKGQKLCRDGQHRLCKLDIYTYNRRYKIFKNKIRKNKQKTIFRKLYKYLQASS